MQTRRAEICRSAGQKFADTAKVSDWSRNSMNWATTQGIIAGKGKDVPKWQMKLEPQGMAARAECASMMKKMLEKNQK